MILTYNNKRTEKEILSNTPKAILKSIATKDSVNKIIQGDNLPILKTLLDDYKLSNAIDLIYIDPPFATDTHFKISEGRANSVSMSNNADIAYSDKLIGAEYLEFIRERLIFLRELMSERASIYLHIDYKIGHYVKIIMDEIFGIKNFRNDIARIKCNPKNFQRKAYGNVKDLILFYTKSNKATWLDIKQTFTESDVNKLFKKIDKNGRKYTTIPLHAPGETKNGKTGKEWKGILPPKGRHWRCSPQELDILENKGLIEWSKNGVPRKIIYSDEKYGKKIQDIWEFKDPQYPIYPTEKNMELLEFIIQSSSLEGDTVLDCFCGSGTTLEASQTLNRHWIGIDKSNHAIKIAKKRIETMPKNLFTNNEFELLKQIK